jgi:hypothetical protein
VDVTRLVAVIVLGVAALADILMASALIVVGALAHAINNPAELKSIAVMLLIAGGLSAPALGMSYFKKGGYGIAVTIVCAPLVLLAVAMRLGV